MNAVHTREHRIDNASLREEQKKVSQMVTEQAERFNSIFQSPNLNKDTINELDKKVKLAYKNLKQLSKQLEENMDDAKKGWQSSTGKKVIKIASGAGLGFILSQASIGYATFATDTMLVRGICYGLGMVGSFAAETAGFYANVVWLQDEKIDDLVNINKDGIEQARILRKLIRQVKRLEGIPIHSKEKHKDHTIIDINDLDSQIDMDDPDRQIQEFLHDYEQLKTRTDEVYFKIIPLLVKKALSTDDPLKQELHNLEASGKLLSKASTDQSLPINYLDPSPGQTSKADQSSLDWKGEQTNRQDSPQESVQPDKARIEYAYKWVSFNEELAARFNIRRRLPYIDTDGMRLTARGVDSDPLAN